VGRRAYFCCISESRRRLAALNWSFWADESCSYIYLSLEGGRPRDSAIERSPDRFLVIRLGEGGHQAEMRTYVHALRDRFFAYIDCFLTRSQVQMASKDVYDSVDKCNDGAVGPECEPCPPRSPENFKAIVLILEPPTTTTAHVTIVTRHQDRAGAGYTIFGIQLLLELRRTIVKNSKQVASVTIHSSDVVIPNYS